MNWMDLLSIRFSSGPYGPQLAQMLRQGSYLLEQHFAGRPGTEDEAASMILRPSGTFLGVRCPHWVLVRRVPDLSADGPLGLPERRRRFDARWPPLRHLDGRQFATGDLQEGDLLLTVWPAAFRQLEAVWAGRELPISEMQGRPQMPAPRWFWIRGLSFDSVQASALDEVGRQFPGTVPAPLDGFLTGEIDVLMPPDAELGHTGGPVSLRIFDACGLPLDPNAVFQAYAEISVQWSSLARPDAATVRAWDGPRRHVFVFSDHLGEPYTPWTDPPPAWEVPPPDPVTPEARAILEGFAEQPLIDEHGVVAIPSGSLDTSNRIRLRLPGEHVRLAPHPHGRLAAEAILSLTPSSFHRLRVVDLARWFPRSPNPRTTFQRYSEGNEVLPLVDGENAFREIWRAVRSTWETAEYAHPDHLPAGEPRTDTSTSQILVSDAWYASHATMLGMRALLSTPRTQPGGLSESAEPGAFPKEAGELSGRFRLIPEAPWPGGEPTSATSRRWWWVADNGALPAGGWLSVTQLDRTDQAVGDDWRNPQTAVEATDLFGATVPAARRSAFAGPQGQLALPLTYDPDWDVAGEDEPPRHRLEATAVVWEPAEDDPDPAGLDTVGKGTQFQRDYGRFDLTFPAAPLQPPGFADPGVSPDQRAHLELGAGVGEARVVLPAGLLLAPRTVAVLNPRSGEVWWRVFDPLPAGGLAVPVGSLGYQDTLLLAFLPLPAGAFPAETAAGPAPGLSQASHLFPLAFGLAERLSGAAPSHPYEALGMARQAIAAGVDARLLAWRDVRAATPDQLARSLGGVAGYNANHGSRRGQALLDALTHATAAQHQKPTFVRTPDDVLAFVGGVDQVDGRYDHPTHPEIFPSRREALWHDVHCRIRGLAALDVYRNFHDRWNAALPGATEPGLTSLPPAGLEMERLAEERGPHAVQINRTIAPRLEAYQDFVEPVRGDQSIRAAYERIFEQARRYLYLEDQYFFHVNYAEKLHRRLHASATNPSPLEFLILVLPERLAEAGYLDMALYAIRRRALSMLLCGDEAAADPIHHPDSVSHKVALFHIRNDRRTPIYVHAKCIIADDLWLSIGSANFIRRSMNYDSEIAAAVIDTRMARGGHRTARELRIELMAEHLRLSSGERPLVEDPTDAFRLVKDILEDRTPRRLREPGIYPVDLQFTTFGLKPEPMDGDFFDAIRLLIDPDGDDFRALGQAHMLMPTLQRLLTSEPDPGFRGFGYLNVTVQLPANLTPEEHEVTFELWKDGSDAAPTLLGPFPGGQVARLGLLETGEGVRHRLRAEATLRSAPGTAVARGSAGPFDTAGFANHQTVTLVAVTV